MPKRLSVVLSQGQSQNPEKRNLEEDLVAALLMENGIDVTVIPHLYDLTPDGTGMLALQNIGSDVVVCSWLYPRAARWVLDRNGIRGHEGTTLLKGLGEDDENDELEDELKDEDGDDKDRVLASRPLPPRKIYCLDLRAHSNAKTFVDEIRRIARESTTPLVQLTGWLGGSPQNGNSIQRFLEPKNDTFVGAAAETGKRAADGDGRAGDSSETAAPQVVRIEENAGRRWYPVIDYSRCTNCMECIDFCLFGVYGVDKVDTILVEQPDNCRKGCPACSRVCPENAIIFPQHKTPAIAGAPVEIGGLKIDLSVLFGAPEKKESAVDAAVRERDEQLLLAGRTAVGATVGVPKRQENKPNEPRDQWDDLIDKLDELDL
jgi:NAD-dependent dihydropyrimidine dehydrogenase PreA subunit